MQVDHARQNRFRVLQIHDVGSGQNLLLEICVHLRNFAISNDDAAVRSTCIANTVE